MNTVKVRRNELLARVRANRAVHAQIYKEAVEGYHIGVIRAVERMSRAVKEDDFSDLTIQLPVPQNHLNDYDIVIDMLEMSTEKMIVIEAESFRKFVRDQWTWSTSFLSVNKQYSQTAYSLDGGDLGNS